MKTNIIDNDKVVKLCNDLKDASNEINEYLNKINQLIELLPFSFNNTNTKQLCENISSVNIVNLKKYCLKINYMAISLEKINLAYQAFDEIIVQRLSRQENVIWMILCF